MEEKFRLNAELEDTLKYDIIDEKAMDFIDFIDDLVISCELCDRDPESVRLPGHRGKSELGNEIEKVYYQIQKLLEE